MSEAKPGQLTNHHFEGGQVNLLLMLPTAPLVGSPATLLLRSLVASHLPVALRSLATLIAAAAAVLLSAIWVSFRLLGITAPLVRATIVALAPGL